MIIRKLEVGPIGANCYIVADDNTKEGIIIDPGAESDTIVSQVKKMGVGIKLCVATHGHVDHIMALSQVKEALKCGFAIHEGDAKGLDRIPGGILAMFGLSGFKPPPADRLLKDGDIVEFGDVKLKVLHTPGHSRGGICLLGDQVVFSGDTLFNCGIGRTDMPSGDYDQIIKSIKDKLMTLPDDTAVYPGHGPETTIGDERRHNPFLR